MSDTLWFIIYLLILIACFPALYLISEVFFIGSLESISKRLKMSSDVAGSTLMAAGSSTPELAVVLFALLKSGHHEAIGVGTIVGSALFNLFAIVGVVFLIYRSKLMRQPLIRDLIFYSASIILLAWFFMDGQILLYEALVFVVIYVVYIVLMYYWKTLFPDLKDTEEVLLEEDEDIKSDHSLRCTPNRIKDCIGDLLRKLIPGLKNTYFSFGFSIVSICAISWLMVHSAVYVSEFWGVPEVIIGLTIIAIGTSVPDLLSSIIVARKGRPGMAINNAIGSNIFDILIGFGLPWLLLLIFSNRIIKVENDDLWLAFALLIGSVLILSISFIINRWKMKKWIGYMLILLYMVYLVQEIIKSV